MNRILTSILIATCASVAFSSADTIRPNVILIIADDLGYADLGCQGSKDEVYDKPVISLDILPTALAAEGGGIDPAWKLDGVNLLPFLTEKAPGRPHETLYWRFNIHPKKPEENRWAIRHGDWMLHQDRVGLKPMELHDLANDPYQKKNLMQEHPERAAAMRKEWDAWNSEHPELPIQGHKR